MTAARKVRQSPRSCDDPAMCPTGVQRVAVVGGGPAGLMAAETLRARGVEVDLYDGKGSVGRKFLIAGKGGLNLTHGEPFERFLTRFGPRAAQVEPWLRRFDPQALRDFAQSLGVATFVGSSGRVFPRDLKAAPLLRGWLRRLRAAGIRFHVNHRCIGWSEDGELRFQTPDGENRVAATAVVFALGGGSWATLGSDGAWVDWLAQAGIPIRPLLPSNCGFEARWGDHFRAAWAGAALKPVRLAFRASDGVDHDLRGELMVTEHGLEGSLAYALSAPLRETIEAHGNVTVCLDLAPDRSLEVLASSLSQQTAKRSLSEQLRRAAGLDGVRAALLRECFGAALPRESTALAQAIKRTPVTLLRTRPLDEAISSAGGVCFSALDSELMLIARPGLFCCGEMLDWEAPTGGYLLTACMASGRVAGQGAVNWLQRTASL